MGDAVSPEPDLIERLRQGETQAIAEAYDAHHHAVRAFATRLLGDGAAAEDLVHDVFIQLPKVIGRYRRASALRTFLIGVAVNHARHHVRASTRRRSAASKLASQPPRESIDPEQEAQRVELAKALERAITKLPLRQRVAFVLCEIEDRTSGEAAEIVNVSEGTIRSRLFHAKRKLRASLEREGLR